MYESLAHLILGYFLQMEYFELQKKRREIFDLDDSQFEPIYPDVDPGFFPNPNNESDLEEECSNNWNLCLYVKVQLIHSFKLLLLLLLLLLHIYPFLTEQRQTLTAEQSALFLLR